MSLRQRPDHVCLHAALAALLVTGCMVGEVPAPPDPDTAAAVAVHPGGTTQVSDPENRKVSTNGLVLDLDLLDRLDVTALASSWLSGTQVRGAAWVESLAGSIGGAQLVEYLAICALDPATELVLGNGATHRGRFGLAQQWTDASCDTSCQRWVSACLLAHANADGAAVPISIRGAHPGVSWNTALEAEFPVQEAAFYGNVFSASHELYACIGSGLGALANPDSYLRQRLCGVSPLCGLVQTGPCDLASFGGVTTTDLDLADACEIEAGPSGAFGDCHVGAHTEPAPRLSPIYGEVVTVYLIR